MTTNTGALVLIEITDKDYYSHAVACYPSDRLSQLRMVKLLENQVILEISDEDYRSPRLARDVIDLLRVA